METLTIYKKKREEKQNKAKSTNIRKEYLIRTINAYHWHVTVKITEVQRDAGIGRWKSMQL